MQHQSVEKYSSVKRSKERSWSVLQVRRSVTRVSLGRKLIIFVTISGGRNRSLDSVSGSAGGSIVGFGGRNEEMLRIGDGRKVW